MFYRNIIFGKARLFFIRSSMRKILYDCDITKIVIDSDEYKYEDLNCSAGTEKKKCLHALEEETCT